MTTCEKARSSMMRILELGTKAISCTSALAGLEKDSKLCESFNGHYNVIGAITHFVLMSYASLQFKVYGITKFMLKVWYSPQYCQI